MATWTIVLFFAISALLVASEITQKRNIRTKRSFRVIGPVVQPEDAHKYRYQVSLLGSCEQMCGGTIISDRVVITAAHCVFDMDPKKLAVMVGITDLSVSGQIADVFSYIIHRGHVPFSLKYDIAVLILQQRLDLSDLTTAVLPHFGQNFMGVVAEVSGWGAQSQNLTYTTMRVVDNPTCKHETRICVEPTIKDTQVYHGDSGGPLVIRRGQNVILIGVVSGMLHKSFIFTDVAMVRPWIDEALQEAKYIGTTIDQQNLTKHSCS